MKTYSLIITLIFLFLSCSGILPPPETIYLYEEYTHPLPEYINLVSISENAVKIEWSQLTGEYENSRFTIDRGLYNDNWETLVVSTGDHFFTDSTLDKNYNYTYRLRAFNSYESSRIREVPVIYDSSHAHLKTINSGSPVEKLTFSPDSRYLISCGAKSIQIWESGNWISVKTIDSGESFYRTFDLGSGSKLIAVAEKERIIIRNFPGLDYVNEIKADSTLSEIDFSPDGSLIAMSTTNGTSNHTLRVFSPEADSVIWSNDNMNIIYGLDFTSDSRQLICSSFGRIIVFNSETGDIFQEKSTYEDTLKSPVLSHDGSLFTVISCQDGNNHVKIWDTSNWYQNQGLYLPFAQNIVFDAARENLIYNDCNRVKIYNIKNRIRKEYLSSTVNEISSVCASSDSLYIACSDSKGIINIWSTKKENRWKLGGWFSDRQ